MPLLVESSGIFDSIPCCSFFASSCRQKQQSFVSFSYSSTTTDSVCPSVPTCQRLRSPVILSPSQ